MTVQQQKSTKRKSRGQETVDLDRSALDFLKSSLLGTILVILSGIVVYADKIIVFFNWNFPMNSRYEQYDLETFIWSISVTISPLLLILAAHLKTKLVAYVVPLYSYTLQFWFIIYDLDVVDKEYTYFYALGSCVLIVFVWYAYKRHEANSIKERYTKAKEDLLSK